MIKWLKGMLVASIVGCALHLLIIGVSLNILLTGLSFSFIWLFGFGLPQHFIRSYWRRRFFKADDNQQLKVLYRLTSNPAALFGVLVILYSVFLFVFAHVVAPDHSPYAAQQINELAFSKPGYKATIFKKPLSTGGSTYLEKLINGEQSEFRFLAITDAKAEVDSVRITRFFGDGLPGQIEHYSWKDLNLSPPNSKTEAAIKLNSLITERRFWLGTDDLGRDFLSRILVGLRVSLSVGFIAVIIALLIGIPIGAAAGFYKKYPPKFNLLKRTRRFPADGIIMWLMSVIWSIPTLLLVFPIVFAFGQQYYTIFIAVGITMWVDIARITRGQVMQEREKEYVEATRSLGFSQFRAIVLHILPNITGPLIVVTAANFAYAILTEAGLSFLGIGVQPPAPSWGLMISRYKDNLVTDPHLALIPGFAITVLVLAFFLLGNGLRDAFDLRSER